jgi:hypothetical protein
VASEDCVEPGDSALQALLAALAERANDDSERDKLINSVLTIPSITQWPTVWLEQFQRTLQRRSGP